ncbi:glycerol-3-phosphate dehydrogenase 1-like protein, partial [Saccoglossus kowalevskii]
VQCGPSPIEIMQYIKMLHENKRKHHNIDNNDKHYKYLNKNINGLNIKDKGLQLISHLVHSSLDIDCNVLMGANLAPEVASGNFCEATIGIVNEKHGPVLKDLFQTDTFRCVVVEDATTVELCGALKVRTHYICCHSYMYTIIYVAIVTCIVNEKHGPVLKDLFQTDTFRCVVVEDATTVELCGALK